MGKLSGKTALVTGATRGIGRGIAEEFAQQGASVAVNHRPNPDSTSRGETVVNRIEKDGGAAIPAVADVAEADQVEEMIATVESKIGPLDVLVNNAGISSASPLDQMPIEMWDEMIRVNLRGVFLPTRFALPGMLEEGSGKIINVTSQLGFKGQANIVHYCAAKGGVITFTRALAREVAPDIHVNAIAPGPIATDMFTDGSDPDHVERKWKELPLKRIGEVSDVAPTAVFLASGDSDYYTGQVLNPDGGDVMH